MDKTIRFEIVTGINSGYFHKNSKSNSLDIVAKLWQDIAKEEFDKSDIYVTAVIRTSKTVYNQDWGCPESGEETLIITGVANKEFVKDLVLWKCAVKRLAEKIKKELKQRTLTCEFMETELYYLR